MTDPLLTIILSFGLFAIGLIGVLFKRSLINRLQSFLFIIMGIGLAGLRLGELYAQKGTIVIFLTIVIFIFALLFIGSLFVIKNDDILKTKNIPPEKL